MTTFGSGGLGRLRTAMAASVAGVLLFAGCSGSGSGSSSSDAGEPQSGGTLRVGMSSEVTTLDPAKGSANAMALSGYAIYDTLMKVEKIGDVPAPNIAESMEANEDFTVWTMKLPEGIKFSDGTPFDAAAVKFNMDRHIDPETASTAASLLSSVESVDAPDATTVVFNLKQPYAGLPYAFAYDGSGTAGYIASPTALEEYGDSYTDHASGVGPYMLESWGPGKNTVLVRNPEYWGEDEPYLDKVEIRLIEDEQARLQALQAGDIDYTSTINPTIMLQAQADANLNFVQGVGSDQDSIVLNMAKAPFDDVRIRRAVSMALDRDEIIALTKEGMAEPAVSLFPESDPFHDGNANPEYDLDEAKKLVAEYEAETGNEVSFTYMCRPTVNTTDVIERQLAAAGMDVKVDVQESTTAVTNFIAGKYDATCWTMAGFLTPDLLPYRFFHSTGDLNGGGFASPEFDALADAARVTDDPAERKDLWSQADKILTEDLPWVWTTSQPIGFMASKDVHGAELDDPSRLRYTLPSFNTVWLSK